MKTKRPTVEGIALFQKRGIWYADFRRYAAEGGGRDSLGTRELSEATVRLKKRLGLLRDAQSAGERAREAVTFETLQGLLEADYRASEQRSLKRAQQAFAQLAKTFGRSRAEAITTAKVRAYRNARKADGAQPASVNYELACLRRAYRIALEDGLVETAPTFKLLEVHNARQGFFTAEQVKALVGALPEWLQGPIAFAFLTGWRIPSEVLMLTWSQVDWAAGDVRLEPGTTKNGEPRVFPFAQFPALEAVLERARHQRKGTLVFHHGGRPIRDYRGSWAAACKATELGGRLPHDLRRSAVRNLVNAGVPEGTAMKLTGHKTRAVFDRYNIVSRSETTGAVERLSGYLGGAADFLAPPLAPRLGPAGSLEEAKK